MYRKLCDGKRGVWSESVCMYFNWYGYMVKD